LHANIGTRWRGVLKKLSQHAGPAGFNKPLQISLKGLSYEIDFENIDKNWEIVALIRAAAGFLRIFRRHIRFFVEIKHLLTDKC
jgi:hypothetical protein